MVRIRNFLRNLLRVFGICSRAVTGIVDRPYRRVLYRHSEKRTILFNVTMANHFELFNRIYSTLRTDTILNIFFYGLNVRRKKMVKLLVGPGCRFILNPGLARGSLEKMGYLYRPRLLFCSRVAADNLDTDQPWCGRQGKRSHWPGLYGFTTTTQV